MHIWRWWFPIGALALFGTVRVLSPEPDPPGRAMPDSNGRTGVAAAGVPARTPPIPRESVPTSFAAIPAFRLNFAGGYLPYLANGQPAPNEKEWHSVEIGDVTGDGRDDLISVGIARDRELSVMLYVYPQSVDGKLGVPMRYEIVDWRDFNVGLALADMNGDGVQDVVITHYQGIVLALSGPGGGLRLSRISSTVADKKVNDTSAAVLDVDGDRNMDVVTHLVESSGATVDRSPDPRGRFQILFGDGAGGVARVQQFGTYGRLDGRSFDSETATSLVTGDFNGDGWPDLAVASRLATYLPDQNPAYISIHLNDRAGSFLPPQRITAELGSGLDSTTLLNLGVGDFNADGRTDLVATPSSNNGKAWVFLQSPLGVIDSTPNYSQGTASSALSLDGEDLDGDGRDDLLVGHSNWGQIGHHLQEGGRLGSEVLTTLSGFAGLPLLGSLSTTGVAAGDLNSDGCTDVAVAASYNGLQVFTGSGCVPRTRALVVCRTELSTGAVSLAGAKAPLTSAPGNPGGHGRSRLPTATQWELEERQ